MKMQDRLDTFWRRIQRWVTNCFTSTPITVLAVEACLPPLPLLIEHHQCMAALRLASSPPEINPAAAQLHIIVPNRSCLRSPQCHRALLTKLNPAKRPLMWKTSLRNIRKHLPIDKITHHVLPLLEGRSTLPLLNPDLVSTLEVSPPDPPPDSYITMKSESRSFLLRQWSTMAPPPPGYPYAPSLAPHPFMGLSKFLAGRIHQMGAGQSYLASHPSWFNHDLPSLCPWCRTAPETFEHAVLHCKSCSRQKELYLPGLDSLDADSPIWTSDHLMAALV